MRKIFIIISILLIILIGGGLFFYFEKPIHAIIQNNTIDEIINNMTLEEKITQMMMPSIRSNNLYVSNEKIDSLIEQYDFGGIILFKDNINNTEQTIDLIDNLQQNAKKSKNSIPLFIGVDQEGGSITRLTTGTSFSGNMALAATNDSDNVLKASNIIGKELNALGFNIDFAPSLDINDNPNNPVIGVRSFSDNYDIVSKYGKEYIKGLHQNKIIAAAKHFPGHGNTETDSHIGLPLINKTYDELKENELIPFQSAIDDNVRMIMTAHIMFPLIENETYESIQDHQMITLPATLSKKIITNILREDLGFEGVVITDALDMDAIKLHFDKKDVYKLAINAGVDLLLMPINLNNDYIELEIQENINMIKKMVKNNEINEDMINNAVKRILKLKYDYDLLEFPKEENINTIDSIDTRKIKAKEIVGSKENHDIEWNIAKQSITLIKNDDLLPIKVKENDNILIFYAYSNEENSINYAIKKLKEDNLISEKINFKTICYKNKNISAYYNDIKKANYIIVSMETSNLSDLKNGWQSQFIDKLINYTHQNNQKTILISLSLPYDIARHQDADAILCAYLSKGMDQIPEFDGNTLTYGPNIPASIYMLFNNELPKGTLPVNIYKLDDKYNYTNEILYKRGYSLK